MLFLKLFIFFENFYGDRYIFSCHLPVSKTFESLTFVLRAHYAASADLGFSIIFDR